MTEEGRREYQREWQARKRAQDPQTANAKKRAWRAANPDVYRAIAKRERDGRSPEKRAHYAELNRSWRLANLDKTKNNQLRYDYGITLAQRDELLAQQNGCCACCGTSNFGSRDPHVDHDHKTGRIRGILCVTCNVGIGGLGDNVPGLKRALVYLEGHAPGIGAGLL